MQDALKRLLELREELERLHQTTERVLAESEHLITELNDAGKFAAQVPPAPPARPRAKPRAKSRSHRSK